MEHDPLGNGDDTLLGFIEGGQLGLDSIVLVRHAGSQSQMLSMLARFYVQARVKTKRDPPFAHQLRRFVACIRALKD